MTDGFSDGSAVATSPTLSGLNWATERASPAAASAEARLAPATANGIIFTVAIIRPGSTTA